MVNEKRLVQKAIRGNVDAYGKLIELHKEYLYRMAFLYVKNEQDALDVVSESILKGFEKVQTLKSPELFKTWITRILINAAKDQYRKNRFICSGEEREEQEELQKGVGMEERMDLYHAIDQLQPNYKSVVILKYFQNMKLKEIAQATGIPEGSVSAYLSRAKQELRTYLEGYECSSL